MEVAKSREPESVGGPPAGAGTNNTNGGQSSFLDPSLIDDGRSSSLSDIDDVSDHELSDYESPKFDKMAPDNDSEAETERVEESPNSDRLKRNIVLSASHGPSPSKLAQSTTYDDVEDDDEHLDDSPSKPRAKKNGIAHAIEEEPDLEDSGLSEGPGKKRKRSGSLDDTGTDFGDDEHQKKRRGSLKSELSDPPPDDIVLSPGPMEEEPPAKTTEDQTPADDAPESDLPSISSKAKKASKKSKRKGRRVRDADEETETGGGVGDGDAGDEHLGEDDETAERGEEADEGEAAAKQEEECKLKIACSSARKSSQLTVAMQPRRKCLRWNH